MGVDRRPVRSHPQFEGWHSPSPRPTLEMSDPPAKESAMPTRTACDAQRHTRAWRAESSGLYRLTLALALACLLFSLWP